MPDFNTAIVPYSDCYKEAFRKLNTLWITKRWQLEPHDEEMFNDPRGTVINKGGFIFVALCEGRAAGVCALCKSDSQDYDYEIAKLAVDETFRGRGLGLLLCRACIDKAKEKGARNIFLESNTTLVPAIKLYQKLGFRRLPELHNAYTRGDIQMVLELRV